jgi:hypothetical protein
MYSSLMEKLSMVPIGLRHTKTPHNSEPAESLIRVPNRLDEEKCSSCQYSCTTEEGWCYMFKYKPIYECKKFREDV